MVNIKINGLPIPENHPPNITWGEWVNINPLEPVMGCHHESQIVEMACNMDSAIYHVMKQTDITKAAYDYVAALSEDVGKPVALVSKIMTVGTWNDMSDLGGIVYGSGHALLIKLVGG